MAPSDPALAESTTELLGDQGAVRHKEPLAGTITSVILSLAALTTLSFFISKFPSFHDPVEIISVPC